MVGSVRAEWLGVLVKYNTYLPKQMCRKSPIAWHGTNRLISLDFKDCRADERSNLGPP
jgi:hypothetical protein